VRALREALAVGAEHVTVLRNYRKDGSGWWNELRVSGVRDEGGNLSHYFGFQNDVTARVEAELQATYLATHDPLTGLPNRARLLAGLEQALCTAAGGTEQVAVLFIDVDGFKSVNDSLGHEAGDLALVAASARLRLALREDDLLGRLSGDEFLAVITDVGASTAKAIAQRAADSVLDSFSSPLDLSGHEIRMGRQHRGGALPAARPDLGGAAERGGPAMYAAKTAGRGRAAFATGRADSAPATGPD
jgi:diguanylate cyclase (GGDEF)-like protein